MNRSLFATTARGCAELLADELRALGVDEVRVRAAGCEFTGDLVTAYRVCLWSRVAHRVLLEIARFPAADADDLYRGALTQPWEQHLAKDATFAIDLRAVQGAPEVHAMFGAQRVKDALVDRLREQTGSRPDVSRDEPDLRIAVLLAPRRSESGPPAGEAVLSLDLSGESLHQRGYRQTQGAAPLRETLAAALLMRAGWPGIAAAGGGFVDPLCGAGTLCIEAALMAGDVAPGLLRERFGMQGWRHHDEGIWQRLRSEARQRAENGLASTPPIAGGDIDTAAIALARANATRAGVGTRIDFRRRPLAEAAPPQGVLSGLVLCNPPYGERLGAGEDLPALYAALGNVLRERFGGWRAALLAGDPSLGRHVGLRATRRHTFWNGPLECRLLRFEPPAAASTSPATATTSQAAAGSTAGDDTAEHTPVNEAAGPRQGIDTADFANRLRKNRRRLSRWLKREDVSCYRLYDADIPEFALAIDLYQAERLLVHVQEYAPPHTVDAALARRRLQAALATLREVLEVGRDQVSVKRRERQRGTAQYARQDSRGRFHEVREGPARLLVNLHDYLDTGLFLDHRPTRALLARLATGRRFLNLFCYTAAATVHAALGNGDGAGARDSVSVDLSHAYTEWAQRNLQLNRLHPRHHHIERADVRDWLRQASYAGERFDLVFLDPPTFSNSKRMRGSFDVQRDHVDLLRATLAVLAPGGDLLFSVNRRDFRLDESALADLDLADISRQTLPPDFERNPRIHRCWHIRRRDAGKDV